MTSERWESRGPRRAPAPADTPEGLLSSPARLSELCQGDAAAMRGARVVLAMVIRGELTAPGALLLQAPDGAPSCPHCGSLLTAGAGHLPQRPLDAARGLAQRCATGDEVRERMGWMDATRSEMGAIAAVMDAVGGGGR